MKLSALLRTAGRPLWKGKAYERTAFRNVEEFIEIVGDLELSDIKTTTIDKWRDVQESKVSPSTINRKLTNIHQVLNFAVEREWMDKLPIIKWTKENPGRVRWLSAEEEQKMFELLKEWGEEEVSLFLTVLIETGMRRGELLKLASKDVEGAWARLWETKTKSPRSVPLTQRAQEALAKGLPWSLDENKLRAVWGRLKESMGLSEDKDFVLHTLRHTNATRLLKKTQNIAVVQKMLGHKKVQTTLRYAHIADDDLLNAVCG